MKRLSLLLSLIATSSFVFAQRLHFGPEISVSQTLVTPQPGFNSNDFEYNASNALGIGLMSNWDIGAWLSFQGGFRLQEKKYTLSQKSFGNDYLQGTVKARPELSAYEIPLSARLRLHSFGKTEIGFTVGASLAWNTLFKVTTTFDLKSGPAFTDGDSLSYNIQSTQEKRSIFQVEPFAGIDVLRKSESGQWHRFSLVYQLGLASMGNTQLSTESGIQGQTRSVVSGNLNPKISYIAIRYTYYPNWTREEEAVITPETAAP